MAITINIYYTGEKGNAKGFAKEMISSGIVDAIRKEEGNLRYEYFIPLDDDESVLLIDSWVNQEAIEQVYQEFGRRSLVLGVHKDNAQAGRFYERHGFRKTGVFEGADEYYLRLI